MAKRLGQHFLFDKRYLQMIVDVADIKDGDTVIEIGPGYGSLTRLIVQKAAKVIAIELDEELFSKLKQRLQSEGLADKVTLVHADALKFDYSTLSRFKVVANIPYYITTPLIFKFIESQYNIASMTITIQKEVAQRICSMTHSKDYGTLSIAVQIAATAKMHFIVPASAFVPPPRVDSAVITLDMTHPTYLIDIPHKKFIQIVKTAFSKRRKTIVNALRCLDISAQDIKDCGINPLARPEELTAEDFLRLIKNSNTKDFTC